MTMKHRDQVVRDDTGSGQLTVLPHPEFLL
ncbi:hypothetical protein BJQ90_03966 [Arthrobacter sp. SO3]|nr:hypothetical protein [Arthrobacter sp. SO3]